MQLLAFSCYNIWPFLDRTVTVCFRDGKYLIKAPIGSGKSFLFFDWPVFGLYKYSNRPMLSMKAQEWYIKILFEHEWKILVCVRNITRTKTGNDTIKSSLFVIEDDISRVQTLLTPFSLLTWDVDAVENIMNQCKTERIECKNETDVQATLNSFIPLQEVFLSTSMLLQDSENVFELAPADRISLFKEIFGLLSIDSATDRINDERKAVVVMLKAKWDTWDIDKKLRDYLGDLLWYAKPLEKYDNKIIEFIQEVEMIQDKISIKDFGLDEWWKEVIMKLSSQFTNEYNEKQKELWALEAQQASVKTLEREKQDAEKQLTTTTFELGQIKQSMQEDNEITIDEHADRKQSLQKEFDQRLTTLPATWFNKHDKDFQALRDTTQEHIQLGKSLKEQQEFSAQTIEQLKQKEKQDQETLVTYEKQIAQLQSDYDSKMKFFCEKIGEDCPFIDQINTWFFNALKKNIDTTSKTRDEYLQKIQEQNVLSRIKDEEDKLKDLEKQLTTLKATIYIKDYVAIKDAKAQFDTFTKQLQDLQRQDAIFAKRIQERENNRIKLAQLEEKRKNLEDTLLQLETKYANAAKSIDTNYLGSITESLKTSQIALSTIGKLQQSIDRITDLILGHKDSQWAIKALEEKEKLLTDLYRIFSKEIMIKVLEDALPFFAEYVNNLLAKMVAFTIHFQPKKTASERLELEISIRDHHGERTVKSLSGWQKAILRLAWILGVAQMTRTKQLFLDETINNIDQETISQVADMLQDYAKLNDISIYLVTHSSQLQQMGIWDQTIEI
jgi:DNA repair exonuclease SbcCD ATPase subunit